MGVPAQPPPRPWVLKGQRPVPVWVCTAAPSPRKGDSALSFLLRGAPQAVQREGWRAGIPDSDRRHSLARVVTTVR